MLWSSAFHKRETHHQRHSADMRHALKLHPQSRCDAVSRIEVEATYHGSYPLLLHYLVSGKINDLCLAPPGAPNRAGRLWEHSCFEAFLCATLGGAYCEFDFAPSYEWVAYGFTGYRNGMRELMEIAIGSVVTSSNETDYEMQISLDLGCLPNTPADATLHLGLSAVIEELSGNKSYWALAHPPGAPDFHHRDCFALKLPPQEQT